MLMRPAPIEAIVDAIQRVRDRLLRATAALEEAHVPYAVIGGNAVAAWITRVDPAAVRFTQDVDLMIRRPDLASVRSVLEQAGFVYGEVFDIPVFLDGPQGRVKDVLHIVYANESVRPNELAPAPDIDPITYEELGRYRIVPLESLVLMKLTSFRVKDRMHLLDLIGADLIDATWPARFRPELADRLQELLDNPEG